MSSGRKQPDNGPGTQAGFINVLKPTGMTSFDVVSKVRSLSGVKQIGHAGTLDKLATGVLPIAIGKACRLIRFLSSDKIYYAEVLLGQRTTTDDIEGEVITATPQNGSPPGTASGALPSHEEFRTLLTSFEGEQDQLPPAYSAIHHEGKRLYQLARANQTPAELKARRVTINQIEFLGLEDGVLSIRVWCAGGTYIRALARDIGEKLGCGACIKALRREKSGPFDISHACSLLDLEHLASQGKLPELIAEPASLLNLPTLAIDAEQFARIQRGQRIDSPSAKLKGSDSVHEQSHIALLYQAKVVAICWPSADNKLQPEVVLLDAESCS
jgi:tRNA pseudouridine55 synthase